MSKPIQPFNIYVHVIERLTHWVSFARRCSCLLTPLRLLFSFADGHCRRRPGLPKEGGMEIQLLTIFLLSQIYLYFLQLYYLFLWSCLDCCKSRLEMLWASGPCDASTSPRVLYRRWRLLLLLVAWTECICSSWQSHWQSGGRALTLMNLMDYRIVCLSKHFAATQFMLYKWTLAEAEKPKDACGLVEVL